MSNRVMLALGEFRFEIGTAAYQNLERQHTYIWSVQDRLGRVGASQFMGRKPGTITLEGTIYPAFRGGLGQIPAMRETAEKGEPLRLVSGTGKILGTWVITKVGETSRTFTDDGRPRRIDFSLGLQEYGEDEK